MRILVLAGGHDQADFIDALKARGHEALLADYYPEPPARAHADRHFRISTLDEGAVLEVARAERVDMVATACTDQALLTAARVSDELGLPFYLGPDKALELTDKEKMKSVLLAGGVPTARGAVAAAPEEVDVGALGGYPLVVKPCDCNSSKGVVRVGGDEELKEALAAAVGLSRSGRAVVEAFLPGREVSVDAWVDAEGRPQVLCASESRKISGEGNGFVICGSSYPALSDPAEAGAVEGLVGSAAAAFGLRGCPLLVQAMVGGGSAAVIELSARMGGGTKHRLVRRASGVDVMAAYVSMVLGEEVPPMAPVPSGDLVELDYVYADPGRVGELRGFEDALSAGLIEEWYRYKPDGARVSGRSCSGDRVAGVLISAGEAAGLREKRARALGMLDVVDGGRSIMFRGGYEW